MHHGRKLRCWEAGIFLAALLVSGSGYAASLGSGADRGLAAPDIVRIDDIAAYKALEMPPAVFPHGKHAEEAAKAGKDCAVCHTGLDGKAPFAYQKLPGKLDAKDIERQFHDTCIACHKEADKGPGAAECRVCHDTKAPTKSAALPVRFNKSVHAFHVSSKLILPPEGAQENCGACHHIFDKSQNKLVWAKGQEDACSACHGPVADGDKPSLKAASHASCVKCHLEQAAAQKKAEASEVKTGPVLCDACHTAAGQAKFPVLKEVPRLLRGQPDATVLLPDLPENGKTGMSPVVFNHKGHEAAADSCRTCHHVRIDDKGCVDCHTVAGKEEGKFVRLEQAMHDPASQHSCVGCHRKVTLGDKNCAGCHSFVKKRPDGDCAVCHAAGTLPAADLAKLSKQDLQKYAGSQLADRKTIKPLDPADMPETVTIGLLSHDFEPAVMPHRKIYQTLLKGYADNALAGQFHTTPEAACAACHHNVPLTDLKQPPKCATCHGSQQDKMAVDKNVPSLKAAYHQQCMACHARMDVKPVATDCKGCHAERPAQAGR